MLSPVRLSVCCLSSVTLVHHYQPDEIFGDVSTPFGTLAIRRHAQKFLRRSSQGTPPSASGELNAGGVAKSILDLAKSMYISETVKGKR